MTTYLDRPARTLPDRDFLWLGCSAGKHDWQFIGGCNARCEVGADCGCSIPVHECSKCGDCDYGDNTEADEVRRQCRL
jgi:hypothetical protein